MANFPSMARRGIAAAGVAVALLIAGPAAAEAVTPNPFYGVVATHYPSQGELDRLAAAGAGTFRAQLDWRFIEPRPGLRNWYSTDVLVAQCAKAGVTFLPDLLDVPKWMSHDRSRPPTYSAFQRNEWRTLLTDYARRYGTNGTFWTEHPEFPKRPITTWEIWNEPNLGASIGGKSNPRRFVTLLKISSVALKAGDPNARVLTGGLFPYHTLRNTARMTSYLRAMYRVPGAAHSFDILGIHPYAIQPKGVLHWIRVARRIMSQNGDGAKPIYASAFGWITGGYGSRYSPLLTTPRQQAANLTKTYNLLGRNASNLGLESALWFTYTDNARKGRDSFLDRAGLFRLNGRRRPSWPAFARVAGGTP
ncbi:MAG: polysaccharide biosynthesis protein PslG [Solirubrobacterales bacterium]|jgi:hypothetical protein|nr:polysaccharide biosynthesis protein PslG [Solirubrobacterales bacterium]